MTFWSLGDSIGKESTCNARNLGLIPGSGSSPGEGNGNPLQHSCLEDPMVRGAWQATVHRVAQSWTRLMAPHSSTLAWKIPWMEEPGRLQSTGSLRVGHDLSDFTFSFHFHALEKEMATHSSILACRIPQMGEPGGLPSMGMHKVGHD